LELGQPLDGEIARARAIQDLVHVVGNVPQIIAIAGATSGEAFRNVTRPLNANLLDDQDRGDAR
jgi:hypothetical protein